MIYRVLRGASRLWNHTRHIRCQMKQWKKKSSTGAETSIWNAHGKRSTCWTTRFLTYLSSGCTYEYIHLRSEYCCAHYANIVPRRDTTRARPSPPQLESGEASRMRYDEQTAHRMVDFISNDLVSGSKPGLKLLDCSNDTSVIIVYIFIREFLHPPPTLLVHTLNTHRTHIVHTARGDGQK